MDNNLETLWRSKYYFSVLPDSQHEKRENSHLFYPESMNIGPEWSQSLAAVYPLLNIKNNSSIPWESKINLHHIVLYINLFCLIPNIFSSRSLEPKVNFFLQEKVFQFTHHTITNAWTVSRNFAEKLPVSCMPTTAQHQRQYISWFGKIAAPRERLEFWFPFFIYYISLLSSHSKWLDLLSWQSVF